MACPFLNNGPVRLSSERESHIRRRHDEFGAELYTLLGEALSDPDELRWSASHADTLLFLRWYPSLLGGKHVIVAVVLDASGRDQAWIVTAYTAGRPPLGVIAWRRS